MQYHTFPRHYRTRRNTIAPQCLLTKRQKLNMVTRISHIALTLHVARLVLCTHHTSRLQLQSRTDSLTQEESIGTGIVFVSYREEKEEESLLVCVSWA